MVFRPGALRWISWFLYVTLVSCGYQPDQPAILELGAVDPYFVALDSGMPSALILEEGGSLLLGSGWSPIDRVPGLTVDRRVWALGGTSRVNFVKPRGLVDLHIVAQSYPPSGGQEPQMLQVTVDGQELPAVTLEPSWHAVRIPLPESLLDDHFYSMKLEFSQVMSPMEYEGASDARPLAAQVTELAVVPRNLTDPGDFLRQSQLTADNKLTLPVGGALTVPLPEAAEGRLTLGKVSGCRSCTLRIETVQFEKDPVLLFESSASKASKQSISWQSAEIGSSSLWIRVQQLEDGFDSEKTLTIDLPKGFLTVESPKPFVESKEPIRTAGEEAFEAVISEGPPHVFVYLVDTLRADSIGVYGASSVHSPRIDLFAADAVVYTRAVAASAWTLPSIVSLLTGVYADRHGIMKGYEKLTAVPPLASRLEERGYDTVGLSQSFIASPAFGVHRGFGDFLINDQLNSHSLRSPRVRRMLLEWLRSRNDRRPVFAYIHTVDPHGPYDPPEGYRQLAEENPGTLEKQSYSSMAFNAENRAEETTEIAHLRALYEGEVQYTDEQFGRFLDLLKGLGLYHSSLIVLVADHGEEFGDHGGFDHGRTLYQEMIRVPLIVKFPKSEGAGTRVSSPVSLVDLAPTIFDLAGWDIADSLFDGPSLRVPLSKESSGRRIVLSQVSPEASDTAVKVDYDALITSDFKCIENRDRVDQFGYPAPSWEVYDLVKDPREKAPLAESDPLSLRCQAALRRYRAQRQQTFVAPSKDREAVSPETLETLRSLGYIQ